MSTKKRVFKTGKLHVINPTNLFKLLLIEWHLPQLGVQIAPSADLCRPDVRLVQRLSPLLLRRCTARRLPCVFSLRNLRKQKAL
jgi:hypothetical protein